MAVLLRNGAVEVRVGTRGESPGAVLESTEQVETGIQQYILLKIR